MPPEMMLQLAEENATAISKHYTWVPVGDSGVYMSNDFMNDLGRRKNLFKKIALAPGRRAFRTLVALNVHGLATKMKKTLDKNPGELQKKWEKLGGDFNAIKKSVEIGAKKKKLFDNFEDEYAIREDEHFLKEVAARLERCGMGAGPLIAFIAAAVPVLVALKPLFKKSGADGAEAGGTAMETIVDTAKSAATAAGIIPEAQLDPTASANEEKFDKQKGHDDEPKKDDKIFGIPKPVAIAGGAVLGLLAIKMMSAPARR